MSIIYYECVFVALVVQHAMRMRHIVICYLTCSKNIFQHYLINGTILGLQKPSLNVKCFVLILSTKFL